MKVVVGSYEIHDAEETRNIVKEGKMQKTNKGRESEAFLQVLIDTDTKISVKLKIRHINKYFKLRIHPYEHTNTKEAAGSHHVAVPE